MDMISFEVIDLEDFTKKAQQARMWVRRRSLDEYMGLAPIPGWIIKLINDCEGCLK